MRSCNVNRDNRQQGDVTYGVTTALQRRAIVTVMTERHLGRHFIREWRKYRGLSLRQLADRMEVEPGVPLMSHANLQRIELYEQPYDQQLLEAASIALECSATDLISVDPTKDGDVIDLVRLLKTRDADLLQRLKDKDPDQIVRVLRAL